MAASSSVRSRRHGVWPLRRGNGPLLQGTYRPATMLNATASAALMPSTPADRIPPA